MTEMHDLAPAYVLDSLSEDEVGRYEAHLDQCAECQREVALLGEGLVAMTMADAKHVPPDVREKVLASIDGQTSEPAAQRRSPSLSWALPVAAVIALVIATVAVLTGDPVDEILAAPDAVAVELEVSEAFTGPDPTQAQVVFSASRQAAAVQFDGLESPGEGRTYQLWLIEAGEATSAGTFGPDEDGIVTVVVDGVATSGQTVAVTEEPEGGSGAPTGDILFRAGL